MPVSYSVHYGIDLQALPKGVRADVERTMEQIAEVVSTVPTTSPFWSSASHSLLQIDVAGWRVVYRVDSRAQKVRVVEVEPIR